ncbi:MAG: Fis family transcriptional regulator [Spirochaetes bacterium]|nr:MAG: Fis family transcriptional regulator [Spirochaetota bacterium]
MDEVSNEVRRLETLIEINALINSQYRDVRVLLSRIMESAERLIGTDASSLLLVDSGTNQLYFEIALGDKGEDVKKYTLEMGEGIAGWVALNNRSLVVNDPGNDPRHFSLIGEDTGYKTINLIAVPLRDKDEAIGVLEVINKSDCNNFNDDDLRFLEVLADQASIAIQNARDFGQLSSELDRLRTRAVSESDRIERELVWKSPKTESLLSQADRIALSDSPVLILGESGTGKELLADRLHKNSNRAFGPFIKVNCAAIPADLIESELFGYVKGAFTDAVRDKPGFFERAGGGSLFLDEIGDLSLPAQAKLLRVLQNGSFQRVGGEVDVTVDVRVIAATNKDLGICVENGTFRQDLYYRLAVLPIEVPPLRDRVEDIEFLAHYFLDAYKLERNDVPSEFSLEALEVLLSYRWPGNVRELQNAVERAVITCKGKKEITPSDLALPGKNRENTEYKGKNLKDSVTLFKKRFVREVLISHGGNQTLAANALGIQRTYLSRMIKDLNIDHRGEEA